MKLRFIEYLGQIYIVVGITYDQTLDYPDCFEAIPLEFSIHRSILSTSTIRIPLVYAREISEENTLKSLLILYGE